ncbi:unnamed protein product [Ceratitis capitata]|uniref:(Mediterranean fruit fly) hypothetical protein n=1 Tax=Ceratitis capitata TaxID=7213 RepID=A0A811VIJ1_CERCA|nr:unnamed protein product [Ceratitis capitata]
MKRATFSYLEYRIPSYLVFFYQKVPEHSIPARYIQVLLMFTAILLVFYQRVNLSVAIVALNSLEETTTTNASQPKFHFWGTFSVQLLSGYLGSHYGTVKLLFGCVLGSSLISIGLPFALIYFGFEAFVALRVVQGCAQGIVFPAVYAHLAKWSPLKERSLLGGISQWAWRWDFYVVVY